MIFVNAFIVCGLLCLICQIVSELTHAPLPVIALGAMVLSALLAPTGLIQWLEAVSGMGVIVTIVDAGASICNGTIAAMHGAGAGQVIFVFAIFVGVTAIGLLVGVFGSWLLSREEAAGGQGQA